MQVLGLPLFQTIYFKDISIENSLERWNLEKGGMLIVSYDKDNASLWGNGQDAYCPL